MYDFSLFLTIRSGSPEEDEENGQQSSDLIAEKKSGPHVPHPALSFGDSRFLPDTSVYTKYLTAEAHYGGHRPSFARPDIQIEDIYYESPVSSQH